MASCSSVAASRAFVRINPDTDFLVTVVDMGYGMRKPPI